MAECIGDGSRFSRIASRTPKSFRKRGTLASRRRCAQSARGVEAVAQLWNFRRLMGAGSRISRARSTLRRVLLLARLAQVAGVRALAFASSCSIYGLAEGALGQSKAANVKLRVLSPSALPSKLVNVAGKIRLRPPEQPPTAVRQYHPHADTRCGETA